MFREIHGVSGVQVGYRSNSNMLVCAPTGAGKTNIAMVAVLHEVSQHRDADGTIHKDGFKIVYVAPMKALAAEVTRTFGSRLETLGLQVRWSCLLVRFCARSLARWLLACFPACLPLYAM